MFCGSMSVWGRMDLWIYISVSLKYYKTDFEQNFTLM